MFGKSVFSSAMQLPSRTARHGEASANTEGHDPGGLAGLVDDDGSGRVCIGSVGWGLVGDG